MLIFDQSLANNASDRRWMNAQYDELMANRRDARHRLPEQMFTNAGTRPFQLYQEFDDNVIPEFHLDEGENILMALMPLARSLPVGREVLKNSRASDSGSFSQSMTGEQATIYDGIDYDLDGTIIPINKNGFKTSWRENATLTLESFDDTSNKQREALRTHRKGIVESMMNGHKDTNGNFIVVDGLSWQGFRADGRVDQVDLSAGQYQFDFTDNTTSGVDFFNAWKNLAERRMVVNNVVEGAKWWVPTSVYWNMQRLYGANDTQGTIYQQLLTIPGVDSIEPSSTLIGNEVLSIPVLRKYIELPVGMAISTIARSRPEWNSPIAFDVVSAVGFNVKTDFEGQNKAIQFAQG